MIAPSWLWIVFTLIGASAQTARNAMQRDLIGTLGATGATTVRFLFGLPFAIVFLGVLIPVTRAPVLVPNSATVAWTTLGAIAQIGATGLMLMAMQHRSFVVAIAYTKTEPVFVALFGLLVLHDRITTPLAAAITLAVGGVMLMSWPRRAAHTSQEKWNWTPALQGITSAGLFALSAIGYRAGILALGSADFIIAASTTLVLALVIQSALIIVVLLASNRPLLRAIAGQWRPSLLAGFMGALASQFWFLAFAVDTAARVRTLALVEILLAQIITRKLGQGTSRREYLGIALMMLGVALLVSGS